MHKARHRLVIRRQPQDGKETLLTTREKVNQVLNSLITPTGTAAASDRKGEGKRNKVQHFYNTEFPWPDKPHMLIKLPGRYIVYDFDKDEFVAGMPQAGKKNGSNIDYTPEGGHLAYIVGNNLYVDNPAVTDEPEGIVCGAMAPFIPPAPGVRTSSAPRAFSKLRRSVLIVSGMVRTSLYPLAAATNASPTPVFPLVGSIIVAPGFNKPFASASSIMASATRSFTLPAGLKYSNLAITRAFSSLFLP